MSDARDDSLEDEGPLVTACIGLLLIVYGCGPNIIVGAIAVPIRVRQTRLAEQSIDKLKKNPPLEVEKQVEHKLQVEASQEQLKEFRTNTTKIAISMIPIVGPLIAVFKKF
jgi:predicted PurR-regulated permease PerM